MLPWSRCTCFILSFESVVPGRHTSPLHVCPTWMRPACSLTQESPRTLSFPAPRTREQLWGHKAQSCPGSWLRHCVPAALLHSSSTQCHQGWASARFVSNSRASHRECFISQINRCPIVTRLFCFLELTDATAPAAFLWADAEPLHFENTCVCCICGIGMLHKASAPCTRPVL